MKRHLTEFWFPYLLLFVTLAGLAILIPIMIKDQDRWEAWCADQGGHVTDHTSTTVTTVVNPANGQPGVGVGSETTYYCLSVDGRILDIR